MTQQQAFKKTLFVIFENEFIIAPPFPLRYAEIRYTQGGYEHMEMAKSYYSHAVKLNPNNMRALYGLLQVS